MRMRIIDLQKIGTLVLQIFIAVLAFWLIASSVNFGEKSHETQAENMTNIIQQAAIQCYALEGAYPSSIDYLVDNYGVILNEEDYYYYYSLSIGSNYMPDIIVISKQ